jgi:transcriptional regulator with XRE-family HTH domain
VEAFWGNLRRSLAVHGILELKEAAEILGFSEAAFTKWANGSRSPSFTSALVAGDFLRIPPDRLARAEFIDLLEHELSDRERFEAVEKEIRQRRSILREAGEERAGYGAPKRKVVEIAQRNEERRKQRKDEKGGV